MFTQRQGWRVVVLFVCLSVSGLQSAWAVTPEDEFDKRIRTSREIQPLGEKPFGEQISLYNGALTFRHVDVDQPGIGLPIQLIRTFDPSDSSPREGAARAFADWRLELPSIQTLTTNENQFFRGDRCTNFATAPSVVFNLGRPAPVIYTAEQWWGGYQLIIPGMGRQDLLRRDSSNTLSPRMKDTSGNQLSFPIVTRQHWMVSCLAQTSNGQGGQAFLVISPEGTKYWMDWLIYRGYDNVGFAQPGFGGVARQMATMMTSRVEDRFGNSLSYQYDANGNLIKIQSSDGRSLSLNYETWTGNNTSDVGSRVTTATLQASDAPSRTWSYSYATLSDSKVHLTNAILPDGSSWAMDVSGLARFSDLSTITYDAYDGCSSFTYRQSAGSANISFKHPSGLVGDFSVGTLIRGRSYVPFLCDSSFSGTRTLEIPNITKGINILTERIAGPGVPEQTWTYSYSAPQGSWAKDCASGCATTVWTDMKSPAGAVTRYTFSNRYDFTESQLLSTEIYDGAVGSTLLRREDSTYASPSTGPWPKVIGSILLGNINNAQVGSISPVSARVIAESGSSYNYKANGFDVFGRITALNRYSPWHKRSDHLDYSDNYEKWILGQVSRHINDDTGLVESQVDYDPVTAQPVASYEFGKLHQKFYYNSDGTLSSSVDGANNAINFSNWKRGVPTSIRFADGAVISANVNDYGWINSVTDESGAATGYSYDAMGRMTSVNYPTGDSQNWNTTTASFEQVGSAEYGLPAGHWRQTTTTGNARKVVYFDGFLRPIVTYEYDASNPGATGRYQRFSYDYKGRVAFASFPGNTDALNAGTRTQYDMLGRTMSVSLDSELGTLTTLTEYLPGNQTRVTDPRGNKTLTGYQVFDQPDYKTPVWIQHPEGAYTDINRDVFGKPLSIRRRDANGAVSVTRSYVYDSYQQLCKTVEPETGATANGYDAAGNLVWTAAGLSLPSTSACDADAAYASGRRIDRGYDVRNRIKALSFPDGNGNQVWSYWPDGAIKQITTTNSGVATYNSYAYNKRRLLIAESQGQADGETWAMGYAYDANGNLAAHRYPSGQTVGYAPNALGQPTQAGSYATGVSYYPNGAIKQFTYGNGIVHTLTQNARQLPDTSQDAYGGTAFLSDGYDYDANGNVAAISDGATGRGGRGNRDMTYDGLGRLISAKSAMFGSTPATYSYDVLDNLIHVVAPGRDHYYCYDANWQLTNVKAGSCGGSTVIGMSYDLQGNLSNKNGQAFVFDYGNRLRQASGKESYRYDGNGRRTLALQSAGNIGSLYDQAGALRFQKNQRQSKSTDYILLGGSLVAEVDWPFGQTASVKDYVNWTAVGGAARYVVEESVDGVTWTSVYEGIDPSWTSLARPSGTYSYRVSACMSDGTCSQATNVAHAQRPAFDIVPLLYQLLLN